MFHTVYGFTSLAIFHGACIHTVTSVSINYKSAMSLSEHITPMTGAFLIRETAKLYSQVRKTRALNPAAQLYTHLKILLVH